MSAVLEEVRSAEPAIREYAPTHDARRLACGVALMLTIGVVWRVGRYLAVFPIWGDEAFILLNLLDLDYQGLANGLKRAQVAPLLFLWVEKAALELLGPSELALRLAPLAAGVGGLLLFWRLCRRALEPLAAALAVAVLAVSYFPMRHACEVKPYAFDLLGSAVLAWAALRWLHEPGQIGRLLLLALIAPVVLLASYPAVFVAGAIGLVLLPAAWRAGRAARGLFILYGVLVLLTFAGHYFFVGRKQASPEEAQRVHDFMRDYWREAFPPAALWRWPLWLLDVHTGNLLAYPVGAEHGASTLSLVLCVVGATVLARQRRLALLALCLFPFALTLLAATLGRYPYGGSARVAQHLAPSICLLMGVGLAAIFARLRAPQWAYATLAVLACAGLAGVVCDWVRPYKTLHDLEVRHFARELSECVPPGDTVLACNHPDEVVVEMKWYLRQAPAVLRWLDHDPPLDATVRRVWLLHFSQAPVDEQSLRRRLRGRYDGWTAVRRHDDFLTAENNVALAWYGTWLRLVPPGDCEADRLPSVGSGGKR